MLKLNLDDGTWVLIQPVATSIAGPVPLSRGDRVREGLDHQLRRSISAIGKTTQLLRDGLAKDLTGSYEVELQFSVGLSSEADLVLFTGTVDASATVTVKWKA
ncbi:MAG: Trypsin-co-occurring domain 1 [Actinomycetota bacterium]|jgi:hypothetical protein|nr:Trypsin-co-occurring domain 1 [Actinomycetota bacterium]